MRAFACPHCRSLIFFENSVCVTCGSALGFDRRRAEFVVLGRQGSGLVHHDVVGAGDVVGLGEEGGVDRSRELRPCGNLVLAACNWLAEAPNPLCSCCALTRTRPARADRAGLAAFARTEAAKRRLVFQLDALGLPSTDRATDPVHGLAFDLLSSGDGPVITGHVSGVITIDLAEGDDEHREARRVRLAEPYRTLLGHLRHEVGHWYWDVLVARTPYLDGFRAQFGDERADYRAARAAHYARPVGDDWIRDYVSHYAAAHPWEDWAETFAHYLHIRDTRQTAAAWGVRVDGPDLDLALAWDAPVAAAPSDRSEGFDEIVRTWLPLTYALNAVNRSMGKGDLYPFVLGPTVLDKLRFVHQVVSGS